jgi:hypothetical protein
LGFTPEKDGTVPSFFLQAIVAIHSQSGVYQDGAFGVFASFWRILVSHLGFGWLDSA